MKYQIYVILLLVLLALASQAFADDPKAGEEINWQVISNGGTDGGSASFGLKGTVSQTATGSGGSASFGLGHGFWSGGTGDCEGKCGDANADGTVNVSDAVRVINYVFAGGLPPDPLACGDANSDGTVNVSDAVRVINYVFAGGLPPGDCAPGDPDWGGVDCCPFVY